MWPLFSNLLESLGRFGVSFGSQDTLFAVGRPDGVDSAGGMDWRRYRNARQMWAAWGPMFGSPWEPYHCVTLFAAIDELERDAPWIDVGPLEPQGVPYFVNASGAPPPWADKETLVIVDLPGPMSVAVGFHLATVAGYQSVCTFDNWPHTSGVLRTERVLGALVYYVAAMDRQREHLSVDSPPMWLCDGDRMRAGKGSPGQFDNRYIIEDRLLPGPRVLRAAGISKVIYVGTPAPGAQVLPAEDVRGYLDGLPQKGIEVGTVSIANAAEWATARKYTPRFLPDTNWSPAGLDLIRSSAGGFGGFVPHPSSGG